MRHGRGDADEVEPAGREGLAQRRVGGHARVALDDPGAALGRRVGDGHESASGIPPRMRTWFEPMTPKPTMQPLGTITPEP